jgi:hypothetical protein
MDNSFEIQVTYESDEYIFPAELIPYGYSYKIEVDVFRKHINFERDEERNFRAIINPDDLQGTGMINKALLAAIATQLIILFKD